MFQSVCLLGAQASSKYFSLKLPMFGQFIFQLPRGFLHFQVGRLSTKDVKNQDENQLNSYNHSHNNLQHNNEALLIM